MGAFDPSGQDSWERVSSAVVGNMRRSALSHNPPAVRIELKRLEDALAAANLRIAELERAQFVTR